MKRANLGRIRVILAATIMTAAIWASSAVAFAGWSWD